VAAVGMTSSAPSMRGGPDRAGAFSQLDADQRFVIAL
jgi:hypothetical protein